MKRDHFLTGFNGSFLTDHSPPAIRAVPAFPSSLAPPLVVAHKGASEDAPEHTLHAYDLAVLQGADGLECDVQLTKDDVLVCVHDATADRTSNGSGDIRSFTLEELRGLDWGSWFNLVYPWNARRNYARARILTLEEFLDRYIACGKHIRLHIDLKEPSRYGGNMERMVLEQLAARNLVPPVPSCNLMPTVSILSFELPCLETIKRLAPTLIAVYVFIEGANEPDVRKVVPVYVDEVAPSTGDFVTTPALVHWGHDQGLPVHAWTVNDPREMKKLLGLGVATIATDRPQMLREVIARHLLKPRDLVSLA